MGTLSFVFFYRFLVPQNNHIIMCIHIRFINKKMLIKSRGDSTENT